MSLLSLFRRRTGARWDAYRRLDKAWRESLRQYRAQLDGLDSGDMRQSTWRYVRGSLRCTSA